MGAKVATLTENFNFSKNSNESKDLSQEERPVIGALVNEVRDALENKIKEIPNSRFYVHVDWKNGGGHEFIAINKNGLRLSPIPRKIALTML